MKIKDLLYILVALIISGIILYLFIYSPNNDSKFIIKDIKTEINGKIKNKIAVRKNLLTHAVVERPYKKDTLIFFGESIDSINIGDYIMKNRNSPFFYIIKNSRKVKKLKFVSIPKSILSDKNFPNDLKDSCKSNWKSVLVDN